jgi:hypothetical protein
MLKKLQIVELIFRTIYPSFSVSYLGLTDQLQN